jgi:peptidyl-prolyl cis-trans isomerase SurA
MKAINPVTMPPCCAIGGVGYRFSYGGVDAQRRCGIRSSKGISRAIGIALVALLALAWGVTPNALWGEVTNRIVATINSDIITLYELNGSIKRLTGLSAEDLQSKDEERFCEVRRAVLNTLINQKITEQQIAKLGIKLTEKDIEEAIEKVKRENNLTQEGLLQALRSEGITPEEYRERIKRELEHLRLMNYEVKSKIVITEEDLRRYYQEHSEDFTGTHEVKLARLLLRVENPEDRGEMKSAIGLGEEILRKLKQGHSFSEMAQAYSQGPAGPEGGYLGWLPFDQLDPQLKERVAKLAPGEYTDLERCQSGVQIIMLMDEKKGRVTPFEEVRDAIYSNIFKGKVEERYAAWLNELREQSFIKVVF